MLQLEPTPLWLPTLHFGSSQAMLFNYTLELLKFTKVTPYPITMELEFCDRVTTLHFKVADYQNKNFIY